MIDTSIYGGLTGKSGIKTPSESLSEIASTRSAMAYARATQLQSDKAEHQMNEDSAIEEALKQSTKSDGQLDEEQAVLNVARISPVKALEMKNDFAKQKAEADAAEQKFNSLSAAERVAHLKNFREKSEFMAEQARGVLALPEEDRPIAFQRMRKSVSDATGEDIGNYYNEDRLKQAVTSSKYYDSDLKQKEDQAHKDRLLEFQADLIKTFKPAIALAGTDRTKQGLVSADIIAKYADVPEARDFAYKGLKGEGSRLNITSPGVKETIHQHDVDNVFKASRDFQDDIETKNMKIIDQFVGPASKEWEDYKDSPDAAKRQFTEQNLIVAFAKIADPNSVVMPGEFKRTLLGQPAAKELYNKSVAFLGGGGLGFDENQLQTMADYLAFAKTEAVSRARPGYDLMKERIESYDESAVPRETKRYKRFFEEGDTSFNPDYKGKSDEDLRKRLDELNGKK